MNNAPVFPAGILLNTRHREQVPQILECGFQLRTIYNWRTCKCFGIHFLIGESFLLIARGILGSEGPPPLVSFELVGMSIE